MGAFRILAFIFGLVFVLAGIAGFVPNLTPDGLLFGYLLVDSTHNIIHLVTGVIFLLSTTNTNYARLCFKLLGIVYAILAIMGFMHYNMMGMQMNMADHIFHATVAVVSLYIGFLFKR